MLTVEFLKRVRMAKIFEFKLNGILILGEKQQCKKHDILKCICKLADIHHFVHSTSKVNADNNGFVKCMFTKFGEFSTKIPITFSV